MRVDTITKDKGDEAMTKPRTAAGRLGAAILTAVTMTAMAGTGSATQPGPEALIGTWTIQGGKTENDLAIQIRLESIDERGRATGTYCSTRPDMSIFGFELRPKGGVKTKLKKGVLKFSRSKRKYALSMNDDGTMRFDFSRKGKKSPTMTMERNEADGCLKRFATADETATHTVADAESGEFVGVWEGAAKGIKIGIHVASIGEDGQASALYCWTRKDGSMRAFDAGPEAAVQSVLEEGTVRAVRGRNSYELVAWGEDKVRHTYRWDGKNPMRTTLKRTTPSGCLARVRMFKQGT